MTTARPSCARKDGTRRIKESRSRFSPRYSLLFGGRKRVKSSLPLQGKDYPRPALTIVKLKYDSLRVGTKSISRIVQFLINNPDKSRREKSRNREGLSKTSFILRSSINHSPRNTDRKRGKKFVSGSVWKLSVCLLPRVSPSRGRKGRNLRPWTCELCPLPLSRIKHNVEGPRGVPRGAIKRLLRRGYASKFTGIYSPPIVPDRLRCARVCVSRFMNLTPRSQKGEGSARSLSRRTICP